MKYGDLTLHYALGAAGRTRWMLRDADGKVHGQSHARGYLTLAEAETSFDSVRTALTSRLREAAETAVATAEESMQLRGVNIELQREVESLTSSFAIQSGELAASEQALRKAGQVATASARSAWGFTLLAAGVALGLGLLIGSMV